MNEPDFDRHLPQPDPEDHFADCDAAHDGDSICICSLIEREIRADYAEARFEMERCY